MNTVTAIEAELGGSDALTAQKRVILEGVRWKLKRFLQADMYLDERRSPVNRRKGSFIPIVDQQKQFLESMRRDLVDLGLERFKKPPEPLEDYLKRRSASEKEGSNHAGQSNPRAVSDAESVSAVGEDVGEG